MAAFTALVVFAAWAALALAKYFTAGAASVTAAGGLFFLLDHPPVFIVFAVVSGGPFVAADIAKLVAAPTSHMVAPLVLLDDHLALLALPVVQVLLEKVDLPIVTLAPMSNQ